MYLYFIAAFSTSDFFIDEIGQVLTILFLYH